MQATDISLIGGCLFLVAAAWAYVPERKWPGAVGAVLTLAGLVLFSLAAFPILKAPRPRSADAAFAWWLGVFAVAVGVLSWTVVGLAVRAVRKTGPKLLQVRPRGLYVLFVSGTITVALLILWVLLKEEPTILQLGQLLVGSSWLAQSYCGGTRLGAFGVANGRFVRWVDVLSWQVKKLNRVCVTLSSKADGSKPVTFYAPDRHWNDIERILRERLGAPVES